MPENQRCFNPITGKNGSVLLLTIWGVVVFTIFAVYMGRAARANIGFAQKIELRDKLRLIAESGIWYGIAHIGRGDTDLFDEKIDDKISAPKYSYSIDVCEGTADCFLTDEGGKINLNAIDAESIRRLLIRTGIADVDKAADLAFSIEDWRDPDSERLESNVLSDESRYYQADGIPYGPKNSSYNLREELLLVRGMTPRIYGGIKPYITVYGSGKININTCGKPVMKSLGMEDRLIDKILLFRARGGLKNNKMKFRAPSSIAEELSTFIALDEEEMSMLDELVKQGKIATDPEVFNIVSIGSLPYSSIRVYIDCVVRKNGQILYWREKFMGKE